MHCSLHKGQDKGLPDRTWKHFWEYEKEEDRYYERGEVTACETRNALRGTHRHHVSPAPHEHTHGVGEGIVAEDHEEEGEGWQGRVGKSDDADNLSEESSGIEESEDLRPSMPRNLPCSKAVMESMERAMIRAQDTENSIPRESKSARYYGHGR